MNQLKTIDWKELIPSSYLDEFLTYFSTKTNDKEFDISTLYDLDKLIKFTGGPVLGDFYFSPVDFQYYVYVGNNQWCELD